MTPTEVSASRLAIQHVESMAGQRYADTVDMLIDLFYSAHAQPPTLLRAHKYTMRTVRYYLSRVQDRWYVRYDGTQEGAGMFMATLGSIRLVEDDSVEPGALKLSIEKTKEDQYDGREWLYPG